MTHFLEAGKRVFERMTGNGSASIAGSESLADFSPYDFSGVPDPLRRWLTYFQQRVVMVEGKRWPIDLNSIDAGAFQPLGIYLSNVRSFSEVLRQLGFCQPVDEPGFDKHRILAFAALVGMYVELAPQFNADLSKSPQDRARMVVSETKGLLASYPKLVHLIGDGVQQLSAPDDTIREDFLEGIRDTWLGAYLAEVQSVMGDGASKRVSDIPRWSVFQAKIGLSPTIIRRLLSEILDPDLAVMDSQKVPASVFDQGRLLVFAALCRELKGEALAGKYDALAWEDVVRTLKEKLGSSSLAGFVRGKTDMERPLSHVRELQGILLTIAQASARNSRTNSSPAKRHLAHRSPSAATSGLVVAKEKAVSVSADPLVKEPPLGLDEAQILGILKGLSWDTREPVSIEDLGLTREQVTRIMRASGKYHGQGWGSYFNPDAPLTHARLRNALELSLRDLENRRGRFF